MGKEWLNFKPKIMCEFQVHLYYILYIYDFVSKENQFLMEHNSRYILILCSNLAMGNYLKSWCLLDIFTPTHYVYHHSPTYTNTHIQLSSHKQIQTNLTKNHFPLYNWVNELVLFMKH